MPSDKRINLITSKAMHCKKHKYKLYTIFSVNGLPQGPYFFKGDSYSISPNSIIFILPNYSVQNNTCVQMS